MDIVGRTSQQLKLNELHSTLQSEFVAVTGRRRIGKTFLIDKVYEKEICFRVTGIQGGSFEEQLTNFTQKLAEYSNQVILKPADNWQEAFLMLKEYLKHLPNPKKKHVVFIDELPWITTARSRFLQMLAHFWNDFLSKTNEFILVVCGSSTSWILKKVIGDKGGLHNRVTEIIRLKPFTLSETKIFLKSRSVQMTEMAIAEIYMTLGGVPFYLDKLKKGKSVAANIEALCFSDDGILRNEYDNLYKALFDSPENHEAIVKVLAKSNNGLTRDQIVVKSKVQSGGPFTRTMNELIESGFVVKVSPFNRETRGSTYKLIDEFSIYFHRFMNRRKSFQKGEWINMSNAQSYKIWRGYAFENMCFKHIDRIKDALGVSGVYTESSFFRAKGKGSKKGIQVDLVLDRRDEVINLCECKFYNTIFKVDKNYAAQLNNRKEIFRQETQTKKTIFNTLITTHGIDSNAYAIENVDSEIRLTELF